MSSTSNGWSSFAPKIVVDLGAGLDHAVKITGVSDDHDKVARCEAALRDQLGTRASVVRSQPYYIDVTHPDANKGVVVGTLSSCCRWHPIAFSRSETCRATR
jgi:hydroxymethylpyrimidine pyrophosphatase-like HAD family hydrolase